MTILGNLLELDRCPYCQIDQPRLPVHDTLETTDYLSRNKRVWKTYSCQRCGGVVLACANSVDQEVIEFFPRSRRVSDSVPSPARDYLQQAFDSLHAPAGSVMLSASAVDAMLKARSYSEGRLYTRIQKAEEDHLITHEMALWAHEVRLDANDQRHADENAALPTYEDARRCVDFALALGTFLFTLPALVKRGLEEAAEK